MNFAGTTLECLAHLAEAAGDDQFEKRSKIAAFTGVGESTVYRWFRGNIKPVGEPLVRLRVYLELHGYKVKEIEALAQPVYDAACVLAFRLATIPEIAELIGYAKGRSGIDGVLGVFHGKQGVSQQKLQEFASFVEIYRDQLAQKQQAVQKIQLTSSKGGHKLQERSEGSVATPPQAVPPLHRINTRKAPEKREAIITSLATSVKALIPLAQVVSSDSFTADERARMRELAGGDGVFVLANLLYRLCGERARKMHSN